MASASPSPERGSAVFAGRVERGALGLAVALGLAAAGFVLWQLFRPYPLTGVEVGHFQNAVLFAQGQNPYGAEFRPEWLYVYGFFHSLLAAPFVRLFGPTFLIPRLLSAVSLALSALVLYRGLRTDRISPRLAATGALLFFVHFAFSNSISAAPNALGLLCYLLSIVVPYVCGFRPGSLVAAVAFSVLAFYTKAYFVIGVPLLVLYLFFRRSWRQGMFLALGFALSLLLSGVIVLLIFPLFFEEAVFYQAVWAAHYFSTWQIFSVLREALPIEAGWLAILAWEAARRRRLELGFPGFMLLASFGVYAVVLSRNTGGNMAYIFHLALPFLIWCGLSVVGRRAGEAVPRGLLVLSGVLLAGFFVLPVVRYAHGDHRASWGHATEIVRSHRDPLCDGALASVLHGEGKTVYDAGFTEGLVYVADAAAVPPGKLHKAEARAYLDGLARKVEQKGFDVVLIYAGTPPSLLPEGLLSRYYRRVETFPLWCGFPYDFKTNLEVWEPLP